MQFLLNQGVDCTVMVFAQCILSPHTQAQEMTRAHSFPRAAEFRAEPRNLPFAAEFRHYRGIRKMTGD